MGGLVMPSGTAAEPDTICSFELEEDRHPRCEVLLDGGPRRPVAVPGEGGVLEQGTCRHELIEALVIDEVVVDTVVLTRPWGTRRHRHRDPDLWIALADGGNDT